MALSIQRLARFSIYQRDMGEKFSTTCFFGGGFGLRKISQNQSLV
jgi:hypothetical protein